MPIVSALETSSGQKVTANDSEPPIINIWRMLADFELCDFNEIYRINAYFHERRSLNNFHRDRVITFEQIAE